MSLHLFLNPDHEEVVLALGSADLEEGICINGLPIQQDGDGRLYYDVRQEKAPKTQLIPPRLRGMVECVSWWVNLPQNCPTQQAGRYQHETAEACVERHDDWLQAQISGPDMDHAYELYSRLRSGRATLVERWETGSATEPRSPNTDGRPSEKTLRFSCPSCKAPYKVQASKVAGKTLTMDCKRCGERLTVNPARPAAPRIEPAAENPEDQSGGNEPPKDPRKLN